MTDRQTDPWANIEAENMFPAVDALYYEADAVDKARAADAAQIASLTAQVKQQDEAFDIEREDATQWRMECVKAEGERDAAQQEVQMLRDAAQAIVDIGRVDLSLQSYNTVWRAFIAAVERTEVER